MTKNATGICIGCLRERVDWDLHVLHQEEYKVREGGRGRGPRFAVNVIKKIKKGADLGDFLPRQIKTPYVNIDATNLQT